MNRRMTSVAAMIVAGAVAGCSEPPFAHTNPLDARTPLDLQVVGAPDTITSRLVTYTLQLQSNPPLPAGIRFGWFSNSQAIVFPFDNSMIRGLATLRPQVGVVGARVGDRDVPREIVLLQRIGELRMLCGARCVDIQAFDEPFDVWLEGEDEHGDELRDLVAGLARAVFIPRTPAMIQRQDANDAAARFRSRGNGAGWLVVTLDGVSDSVFISVNQRATSWTPVCPGPIAVNESVMLATVDHVDANQHPLSTPDAGIRWTDEATGDGGVATVTEEGMVTGVSPGTWSVRSVNPGADGAGFFGCLLEIVP